MCLGQENKEKNAPKGAGGDQISPVTALFYSYYGGIPYTAD